MSQKGPVHDDVFSRNGTTGATASEDRTARTWDNRHGKPASEPSIPRPRFLGLSFDTDGQRWAKASAPDMTARRWELQERTGVGS